MQLKLWLQIAAVIAIVGFVLFLIPVSGSQVAGFSVLLASVLVTSIIIWREVSKRQRGKGKSFFTLLLGIFANSIPSIFILTQLVLLIMIFSKYPNLMADEENNMPPMLIKYYRLTLLFIMLQLLLLKTHAYNEIGETVSKGVVMQYLDKALIPGFVVAGSISLFYIAWLYTVITRFITDG